MNQYKDLNLDIILEEDNTSSIKRSSVKEGEILEENMSELVYDSD